MNEQEIMQIKQYQMLFGMLHPVVEQELIKMALCLFMDASGCTIDVKLPELVRVSLKPYGGFRGFVNKYVKRYDKKHKECANNLLKGLLYWLPVDQKTKKIPKIEIMWEE